MKVAHEWSIRAKCECGYIWTNPISHSVVCKCGNTEIKNNEIIRGGTEPINEDEFKQEVSNDTGVSLDDLILVHY